MTEVAVRRPAVFPADILDRVWLDVVWMDVSGLAWVAGWCPGMDASGEAGRTDAPVDAGKAEGV